MDVSRYVIIKAIKTRENELIPIWDDKIIYENTEMYGKIIRLKDSYREHFNLIECIFDIKTKKIKSGIEIDNYPTNDELEFKIGDVVFVEKSNRKLYESKIINIVYETYDLDIIKGNKIYKSILNKFNDINFKKDHIYAFKNWKPFYILENGGKIEWDHYLYHKILFK